MSRIFIAFQIPYETIVVALLTAMSVPYEDESDTLSEPETYAISVASTPRRNADTTNSNPDCNSQPGYLKQFGNYLGFGSGSDKSTASTASPSSAWLGLSLSTTSLGSYKIVSFDAMSSGDSSVPVAKVLPKMLPAYSSISLPSLPTSLSNYSSTSLPSLASLPSLETMGPLASAILCFPMVIAH